MQVRFLPGSQNRVLVRALEKAMKITFTYNLEKDIWCLVHYGKSSQNSNTRTKVYEELVSQYGEQFTQENVGFFLKEYYKKNNIDIQNYVLKYQEEWNQVADEYTAKANKLFGIFPEDEVTVYLTANNRCPYNIGEKFFFVSLPAHSMRKTVMHELWHFYTWYAFGVIDEKKIGKARYNDLKESLTVLLNLEFKDLLGDIVDNGYPQHQELRKNILEFYQGNKDLKQTWNHFAQ